MRSRLAPRLSYANVAATLAVVLALTSPAWADPAANSAASLGDKVKKALGQSKKANKTAKAASKKADQALSTPGPQGASGGQGPQGAQGGQGTPGTQGAQGSPAASWIAGGTDFNIANSGSQSLSLFGTFPNSSNAAFSLSPNTQIVVRDLRVVLSSGPGTGVTRTFTLLDDGSPTSVSCPISGSDRVCNSGGAVSATIEPGSSVQIQNSVSGGTGANTNAKWGLRATAP